MKPILILVPVIAAALLLSGCTSFNGGTIDPVTQAGIDQEAAQSQPAPANYNY